MQFKLSKVGIVVAVVGICWLAWPRTSIAKTSVDQRANIINQIPCTDFEFSRLELTLEGPGSSIGSDGNIQSNEPTQAFGIPINEYTKVDWAHMDERQKACLRSGAIKDGRGEMSIHGRLAQAPDPDRAYANHLRAERERREQKGRAEEAATLEMIKPALPPSNTRQSVDCTANDILSSVQEILAKQYSIIRLYGAGPSPIYTMSRQQLPEGRAPDFFAQQMFDTIPQCRVSAVTGNGTHTFYVRVFEVASEQFVEVTPFN